MIDFETWWTKFVASKVESGKCPADFCWMDLKHSFQNAFDSGRLEPQKVLQAIKDYEPTEICKDEFAYDRMVQSYKTAASKGLE